MNTITPKMKTRDRGAPFALLLLALLSTMQLRAATYNVNTTTDGTSSSGTVNLRGAILAADAAGGSHTINVPAGTYNLTLGEITFGNKAQNITIAGTGSVTINMAGTGSNQDRIFNINPSAISGITTSVSGIGFTNGYLTSDPYGGGAIVAGGPSCSLSLTNCSFSNNTVYPAIAGANAGGGAISFIYGGALTITNCTFSGNTISYPASVGLLYRTGGAIYTYTFGSGPLYPDMAISITGSTFSGNSVTNGGQGGAIFMQADGNGTTSTPVYSVNISRNNFTGNSASGTGGLGGAISERNFLSGSASHLIQYNRFVGNTAGSGNGSALYMDDNPGSITATNNWWGCNGGPGTCADKVYRSTGSTNSGTLSSTPYLQLRATASPASICAGATSTVTADFSINSASTTIATGNLSAFAGVPVSFQATLGTVSPASAALSSGAATTTYTAGSTGGTGTVNALVDNVPASDATARATITVNPATGIGTAPPATTTICAGNTATISVTASGGGSPTYQWRRGTTNLSNGATGTGSTLSGVTSATLTITNAGASDAASNYNVVVSGCGSVTSGNAALVVSTPGTWLGGSSTAWSNTANWSCGVLPTSATNVVIPAGTTFSPQINISTAAVNDITINSGASLTFSGSTNVLSVSGAITNNGTLNPANGRISFDGTNQTIPALTYDGLTINGGGTKTIAGSITITSSLVFGNGFVTLGANNLTIGGSATISGAGASSFAVVNGTGNLIQQNIGSGGRSGAVLFPVGISSSSYTPVTLTNTGTADAFSVDLLGAVYAAYDAAGNPTAAAQTTSAVNRTWRVTEGTAGGSSATLTFQWNAADELTGFTRSSCYASHYYSGSWHRGAVSAAAGSNPYTQTLTGVTTFSPFGVGSGASPLPLRLLSFEGEAQRGRNELRWTIAPQQESLRFEIQRSSDGYSFEPIGAIDATDPDRTAYSFTDPEPAAIQYYRLLMMDGSGDPRFSRILVLRQSNTGSVSSVSPNPFSNELFIQLNNAAAGQLQAELRNALGQVVMQHSETLGTPNASTAIGELGGLPAGTYFLIIRYDGKTEQLQLVKD